MKKVILVDDSDSIRAQLRIKLEETGFDVLEAKNGMISSATVISDNCMDADALATILMLLDVDQGIQLINSINNTEAFVIYFEDSIMISRKSKGFEALRERGGN